jgi:AcrR family transcriptional regulator
MAQEGETGLAVERVAARAGVSKATIYRRWSSMDEVLLAAVEGLAEAIDTPDTGDLRRDLLAIADSLTGLFAGPHVARLVATLAAQMASRPELARAVRDGFLAGRRRAAADALAREQRRGGLRDGVDLEVAVDLLAAPFYYRLLMTGDPIDGSFAERVVDAVLAYAGG